MLAQLGAILATGNTALVDGSNAALDGLSPELAAKVVHGRWEDAADLRAVLFEGEAAALLALTTRLAAREGAIVAVATPTAAGYEFGRLLEERTVSTNTTAAGGNASLMSLG